MTSMYSATTSYADFSASCYESPSYSYAGIKRSVAKPTSSPSQDARSARNKLLIERINGAFRAQVREGGFVSVSVLSNIQNFMKLLPEELPAGDVYFTGAGSLSFDWDDDTTCQLSVMLQNENKIAFAAYFSGDRIHGSANFTNKKLPDEILSAIKKWSDRTQRSDLR